MNDHGGIHGGRRADGGRGVARTRRARLGQLVALTGMSVIVALTTSALPASATSGNRVTNTRYGYTFVLPKGWNEVSLSSSELGALLGGVAKLNAGLKKVLTSQVQSAVTRGVKTFAIRAKQENGGFFDNLSVGVFAGTVANSDMGVLAKNQLTSVGAKNVTTKSVRFPFGNAIEATFTLAPGSGRGVYETQVYAVHGGSTYILTFTAGEKPVETRAAASVMPTWQFK